jgi:hypothetical protein
MQTIVLITRENNEKVTHVSVYLCDKYEEAFGFCRFINRLALDGGEKFAARQIEMNKEYSLEKYLPFTFDDIVTLSDRTMQKLMRELDSRILPVALKTAKKEVKEHFFRNMSKRAGAMLKEDMGYYGPVTESDIEDARQMILDTYFVNNSDGVFKDLAAAYRMSKKIDRKNQPELDWERNYIVLVFRGTDSIADSVSLSLFNTYQAADNFCNFLNDLKPAKGTFVYARHAEQMLEYEIIKPLFVRFDQIFEFLKFHGYSGHLIIRDALKKFAPETLFHALNGMDKRSRELIMRRLPVKTVDRINEIMESSDEHVGGYSTSGDTREAQEKILKAINKNIGEYKNGDDKFRGVEVYKD